MSDVIGRVGQQAVEKTVAEEGKASLEKNKPADGDIEKFRQAMEKGSQQGANGQLKEQPSVTETGTGENNAGLGDRILNSVERMKQSQDNRVKEINKLLENPESSEMSTQELMKLQLELVKLTEEREVTAKVADKTGQGVQTLVKNQ